MTGAHLGRHCNRSYGRHRSPDSTAGFLMAYVCSGKIPKDLTPEPNPCQRTWGSRVVATDFWLSEARSTMSSYLAIHVAIALAVGFAVITSKQRLLWLTGFLLPLSGLMLVLGVRLSWPQVLPFILILVVFMLRRERAISQLPASGTLLFLLAFGVGLALWFFAFSEDVTQAVLRLRADGLGIGQNELRYPVQILSFLTPWIMLAASYALVETDDDLKAALNGFVMGNLVSIGIGLYQSTAQGMGLPWLENPELAKAAQGKLGLGEDLRTFWVRGGLSFARLHGLGGEPKHTAAFAVMAITLLVSQAIFSPQRTTKIWPLLILFAGIILSMSTSSWIGLTVASVGLAASTLYSRHSDSRHRNASRVLSIAVVLSIFFLGILWFVDSADRDTIINQRFQGRLESRQTIAHFEPKDAALLTYLADHPENMFLGFGPGGASFRLAPTGSASLALEGAITPTYTFTRVLSEVGLLGVVLMGWMYLSWRNHLRNSSFAAGSCFITVQGLVVLVQPMWVLPAYLFLVGAFLGNASSSSPSRSAKPAKAAR